MKKILSVALGSFLLLSVASDSFKKEIKIHRENYKKDFLKSERSPFYNKKDDLKYLRFYKPKKKYKINGTFTKTPEAKPFDMATYSGMVKPYRKYGTFAFKLKGKDYSLAVYQSMKMLNVPGYKDYLFLPFRDLTNDITTYGGGRYINLKTSDIKDGNLTLDFNKNYNPWCAFSDGYNCPIPPKENHLNIAIKAGEKKYGKKDKKG